MAKPTIEHVIVLMLENRSFDHMLGYLDHPGLEMLNPDVHFNEARTLGRVSVSPTASPIIAASPQHHHTNVMAQLGMVRDRYGAWPRPFEPEPVGYLVDYSAATTPGQGPVVMRCFAEAEIPVLATLAKRFAVFDHWFCSVPGSTLPNRRFLHAGSSRGATDNSQCKTFSGERTVFEMLSDAGEDWAIFHQDATQTYMYRHVLWNLHRVYPTRHLIAKIREGGPLPTYSFVDPDHGIIGTGNSQHPGDREGTAIAFEGGERLIATIYEALRSQPEIFRKTAFLITYDEHGGFYDRYPPPTDANPPDGISEPRWGFDFTMLGPRVPAVLIHPALPKLTVVREVFDHASVPALIRQWFAPGEPPVGNRWVDGVADPLANVGAESSDPLPDLSGSIDDSLWSGEDLWVTAAEEPFDIMARDDDLDELQRDLAEIAMAAEQFVRLEQAGISALDAAAPELESDPALARIQAVRAVRSLFAYAEAARAGGQ